MYKKPKLRLINGGNQPREPMYDVIPITVEDWICSKPHGRVLTVNHTKDYTIIIDGPAGEHYMIERCHCPKCARSIEPS